MANATFNGVNLGDHAWVSTDTQNQVEVHLIPRADGAIVRRRGAGVKTLTVHGWIKKDFRTEIQQYFNQLGGNMGSDLGDLIVDGYTYPNCVFNTISQSGEHNNWATFTITFTQSGD
jgi:hypothetical protein